MAISKQCPKCKSYNVDIKNNGKWAQCRDCKHVWFGSVK